MDTSTSVGSPALVSCPEDRIIRSRDPRVSTSMSRCRHTEGSVSKFAFDQRKAEWGRLCPAAS